MYSFFSFSSKREVWSWQPYKRKGGLFNCLIAFYYSQDSCLLFASQIHKETHNTEEKDREEKKQHTSTSDRQPDTNCIPLQLFTFVFFLFHLKVRLLVFTPSFLFLLCSLCRFPLKWDANSCCSYQRFDCTVFSAIWVTVSQFWLFVSMDSFVSYFSCFLSTSMNVCGVTCIRGRFFLKMK